MLFVCSIRNTLPVFVVHVARVPARTATALPTQRAGAALHVRRHPHAEGAVPAFGLIDCVYVCVSLTEVVPFSIIFLLSIDVYAFLWRT